MPEKVVKYDSLRRYDEAIKSLIESSGGMSVDELPKFSETSITSGSALESSGQAGYMYYIGEWTSGSGMMGADYSDIRAGDLIAVTKAFDWGEMAPVEYVNLGQMPKDALSNQYWVWDDVVGTALTGYYTDQPTSEGSGANQRYVYGDSATLYAMGGPTWSHSILDMAGFAVPDIQVSKKGLVTRCTNKAVITVPQLGDGLSFDRDTNTLSAAGGGSGVDLDTLRSIFPAEVSAWEAKQALLATVADKTDEELAAMSFDELGWELIGALGDRIAANPSAYSGWVGRTVQMTLTDNTKATCVVVGVAADDLADGTGKAALTFWMQYFPYSCRMNSTNVTTGGWAESEMRGSCNADILYKMPSAVRENVKLVSKRYSAGILSGATEASTTTDDHLWMFSASEVFGVGSYGDEGAQYQFWSSGGSRIAYGPNSTSAYDWWLRSVYGGTSFRIVYSNGSVHYGSASNSHGAAAGFCI